MTRNPSSSVAGVSFLAGPLLASAAYAGTWQQAPIPFESAHVSVLALAPSQPARVYAGVHTLGVYRTDNRGVTWTAANGGLPTMDASAVALDVEATNADRAIVSLAGSMLFRTVDAGATWTDVSPAIDGSYTAVRIDGSDPSILLLGVAGGSGPGIYRSTNTGATWTRVSASLGAVHVETLAARPADPNVIVAGHGSGAAKSTDRGVTWASTGASAFTDLVFSPADPDRVWGANKDQEIERSDDAGDSFTAVSALPGFEVYSIGALAAHPLDPDLLLAAGTGYGCDPFVSSRAHVWETTDAGTSWGTAHADTECGTGGPTGLAFDPASPAHVYLGQASDAGKGFDYSADGGANWTTRISGFHQFPVQAVRGDLGSTVYALRDRRFYRYSPSTWVERGSGKGIYDHSSLSLEANCGNANLVHDAGAFFDSDIGQFYADRSTDGGLTWLPAGYPSGLPIQVQRIVTNHGDGTHVYATSYSGLFRSDDSHAAYALVNAAVEHDAALVVDPNDWQRLFCTNAQGHDLALSTDGGASFVARSTGLPAPGPDVLQLFQRKSSPDELTLVYDDGRVFETFDAGLAWSLRYDLGYDTQPYLAEVTWDPASGHVFVAVRGEGIYTRHPHYVGPGLPTANVSSLWYSPGLSTLFAGTSWVGLWQQEIAAAVDAPTVVGGEAVMLRAAPNPFSTRTTISLSGPAGATSTVEIADVAGRIVRRLDVEGRHVDWDGTDPAGRKLPAGVYFLRSEERGGSAKVVLLR